MAKSFPAQRVTTSTRSATNCAFRIPGSYALLDATDDSDMPASFVCPNCDGDITEAEHSALGICGDCYFAISEGLSYQECMH